MFHPPLVCDGWFGGFLRSQHEQCDVCIDVHEPHIGWPSCPVELAYCCSCTLRGIWTESSRDLPRQFQIPLHATRQCDNEFNTSFPFEQFQVSADTIRPFDSNELGKFFMCFGLCCRGVYSEHTVTRADTNVTGDKKTFICELRNTQSTHVWTHPPINSPVTSHALSITP